MNEGSLTIYFIHSAKSNFNELLYLPALRSRVLSYYNLIFPDSNQNKEKYYKDVMDEADVFVAELTNPDQGFNMELKYAIMSKKPILALAQKNVGYEEKYQKLLKNVLGYSSAEEVGIYVEKFAEANKNKANLGKVVDSTVVLGVLN